MGVGALSKARLSFTPPEALEGEFPGRGYVRQNTNSSPRSPLVVSSSPLLPQAPGELMSPPKPGRAQAFQAQAFQAQAWPVLRAGGPGAQGGASGGGGGG